MMRGIMGQHNSCISCTPIKVLQLLLIMHTINYLSTCRNIHLINKINMHNFTKSKLAIQVFNSSGQCPNTKSLKDVTEAMPLVGWKMLCLH